VLDIGQQGAARDTIAAQAIGDQALGFVLQSRQQVSEEISGGTAIALLLYQDIQHDPVLIRRTPQIMQHASDPNEHLIQVPCVPWPRSAAAQPSGKCGAEFLAPVSDALMGEHHPALGQDHLAG
jgi:hypothetical protein